MQRSNPERPDHTDPRNLVADGLLTIREAAAFLRVGRSTIYAMMDSGELPFAKLGRRSRRIPRRAVVELAAAGVRGGKRAEAAHPGRDIR